MKNSFTISLLVFVLFMLASCRTEYIPVESVRYDSVFFEKLMKDSIFIRDSVHVKEKGDTVEKLKYKYIYRYVLKSDTVFIERRDTISVPVLVEKPLTWWEKQKRNFNEIILCMSVMVALYLLIRWIVKRTRKE